MSQRICTRLLAVVAFVALAATGWDAEAGWRRHHRQASCCWEPVCCEPVCDPCCRPVCETVCDPCRVVSCAPVYVTRTIEPSCCSRTDCCCNVVRETVVVPATVCCEGRIVATERATDVTHVAVADTGRAASPEQRPAAVRNVSTSSARTTRTATTR